MASIQKHEVRALRIFLTGRSWAAGLLLALFAVSVAPAQNASDASSDAHETSGRLVLVLPFENRSGQPTLQWIGDSFPDTINQRLNSAGFLTITRDDRQYALDHLGFPVDFRPTHATTIRIAQTLDANFVVVGSFNVQNGKILVQAQVLEVDKLRLSQALNDSSELARLFDVENAVAWKVARQIDPKFSVAEQTFLAASGGVKLTAFEGYIRGITATNPQERIKRLQGAVMEEPKYAAALLALGKAQYTDRQYAAAAATLIKVPRTDRSALEAGFYLGLAHFNAAKYAEAESAFAFVASRLPLPEVVNNQGVAASRQGRDAGALFQRATAADPGDADYHFNLAVSLMRRGRRSRQPSRTRPDSEAPRIRHRSNRVALASHCRAAHRSRAQSGGRDGRLRASRKNSPQLLRGIVPAGCLSVRPDAGRPSGRASSDRAGSSV